MKIFVLGINHKTAPVDVRERLTFADGELKEALGCLPGYLEQGVILATCNRTEVYGQAEEALKGRERALRFLRRYQREEADLSPYLYYHEEEEAVRHLFGVASGINSMIIGESEILGQVRQALIEAEAAGVVKLSLSHLYRHALRVGRRVREETRISRNSTSVSAIGVELARKLLGHLSACQALVIGAGEASRLTAEALTKSGVSRMVVASRTYERAEILARRLRGEAIALAELKGALTTSDIVVSASSAPHFIIRPKEVAEAMRRRPERPLFLIDIAVPRDIDPEVKKIERVFLYTIDDLEGISEANRRERERDVGKARGIIEVEIGKFAAWRRNLEAVPRIKALHSWAEKVRRRELAKAYKKSSTLKPEERERVEAMTRAIVKKMLHPSIAYLKKQGDGPDQLCLKEEFSEIEPQ